MLGNLKIANADFTSVDITSAGGLLLAENKRRFYALVQNVSNTDIWILFSTQGAVGDGILIPANGFSFEIDRANLWQGSIFGIHAAAGSKTIKILDCY